MPLAVGAVIFVVVICLVLGKGNFKKGFLRFCIVECILLAVYLLCLIGIVVYVICKNI